MKTLDRSNLVISTVLAFALIPLSGFATDIYLPSFPAMAKLFGTSQSDIQLSLVVFIVSSGIGQLFAGSLVDSFGRYRLTLVALLIFSVTSFIIAWSHDIAVVLAMRVVQGLMVALIVVSKRAFILDVYTGDKLKHYTSLFSIVWATAPIVAPFLGGFLHHYFGWRSNFYFLGSATLLLIVLELIYSGETNKQFHPFNVRSLLRAYADKLSTLDFVVSLLILGLAYSMVIMYNMSSPFIIEKVFHESAVVTGNVALLSGVAILIGGLISKATIQRSIISKMSVAGVALFTLSISLTLTMTYFPVLGAMIGIVVLLHIVSGFTFNTFYAYAFNRFSTHAGIVSGLTGGGLFIITSLISFSLVGLLEVHTPVVLGVGYMIISILMVGSFFLFMLMKERISPTKDNSLQLKIGSSELTILGSQSKVDSSRLTVHSSPLKTPNSLKMAD